MSANVTPSTNRRYRLLNGWQLRNRMQRHEIPVPPVPTKWDRTLYRHSLDEKDALAVLAAGGAPEVAKWIRHNYNNCYIPETILEALGLDSRWISL